MNAAAIWIRFTAEGFHCWPDAPVHRAYLRAEHRHLFHVKASCEVSHDDREVEFHDLMAEARNLFADAMTVSPIHRSCEMLARHVATALAARFKRPFEVDVSEDGEAGATVMVDGG